MKKIFVDTSTILALSDARDVSHIAAAGMLETLLEENAMLYTNNYVVVESAAIVQSRLGLDALENLQTNLLPFVHIDWVDQGQHSLAMQAVFSANKRKLSFVDCSASQTMRLLEIDTAFTFDAHFGEQGFTVIP